jgi:hypothetical protein
MNIATIFAFLLASGVCGQSDFQGPDGQRLVVMVCPRIIVGDTGTAPDTDEDVPSAPTQGQHHT